MIDDFETIKRRVEELRQSKERAEGKYQHLKGELLRRYKCSSLKEARQLLLVKQREEQDAADKYRAEMGKFREEFGELLELD
jgi:hypothetical protein